MLAILTAPYFFLYPTAEFYGSESDYFTNHIIWSEYTGAEVYVEGENSDTDIMENGKFHKYKLPNLIKYGMNTAEKTNSVPDSIQNFTVVFYTSSQTPKKFTPIELSYNGKNFYFEWNGNNYVIDDESSATIIDEINVVLNGEKETEEE